MAEPFGRKKFGAGAFGGGAPTIEHFRYAGDIAVGASIGIDMDTGEVSLRESGEVIGHVTWSGELFKLKVGSNIISYRDDEAARTMGIRVMHKPRYVWYILSGISIGMTKSGLLRTHRLRSPLTLTPMQNIYGL